MRKNTPKTIKRLSDVVPKVIVADPNGDNIIRKALELLPSYRSRGEESFRLKQLKSIFESAGYILIYQDIISTVPPFTPKFLLPTINNADNSSSSCG